LTTLGFSILDFQLILKLTNAGVENMLDIKQAVAKAKLHVSDLFTSEGASDFLLEEIDMSADKKLWIITVSFLREEKEPAKGGHKSSINPNLLNLPWVNGEQRLFKMAVVDSSNGELVRIVDRTSSLAA
jgi:hypothetical protein